MNEYAISEYAPNIRDDSVTELISYTLISTNASHIKIATTFINYAIPIIFYKSNNYFNELVTLISVPYYDVMHRIASMILSRQSLFFTATNSLLGVNPRCSP